jgi:glutathione S-transferase
VIRLLGRKTSGNVQKVLWGLGEMGIEYVREDYGRQFNNTQGDYLRLNPNGKVPTLVDGDVTIWESNSILRYLGNRYEARFYATDPAKRSRIERWMDWQLGTLDGPYLAIFRESRLPAEQRSAQYPESVKQLGQTLTILDDALRDGPWIAGADKSIADFCLAPIVHRCLNFAIELPPLAHARAWHSRALECDAFKAAIAG